MQLTIPILIALLVVTPAAAAGFRKNASHLALDDVKDSIRELQYYREQLFRPLPVSP